MSFELDSNSIYGVSPQNIASIWPPKQVEKAEHPNSCFETNPFTNFMPSSDFDPDNLLMQMFDDEMLSMFDAYNSGIMSKELEGQIFTSKYNTNTNLAALNKVYNPDLANKLANIAAYNAKKTNTIGFCSKIATNSLCDAGLTTSQIKCPAACQVAEKLSKHQNFKAVSVAKDDLKNLPAGCVIVWQPNAGHPYGHIAVTLGDGNEASDHIQKLCVRDTMFSVYVPVGTNNK